MRPKGLRKDDLQEFFSFRKAACQTLSNFERHDKEEYIRINNQDFSFLQENAGNRTANQIIDGLHKKILLYRFQSLNLPSRFSSSIQEHRDLMEAFRQRDHLNAEALVRAHPQN